MAQHVVFPRVPDRVDELVALARAVEAKLADRVRLHAVRQVAPLSVEGSTDERRGDPGWRAHRQPSQIAKPHIPTTTISSTMMSRVPRRQNARYGSTQRLTASPRSRRA